jgi:curved DNA-binding protein CbpA
VTDYFALLGEPRRPWLDADRLKEKFLALSRQTHPDRRDPQTASGPVEPGQAFAEINAAWNCLRDPRNRLRHLLQLELGNSARDAHSIPSELMSVSLEVGSLCREADGFLNERETQTSALVRAQMFERGQELAEKLMAMQQQIGKGREDLLGEVQKLDATWANTARDARQQALKRLKEIESVLGFAGRWLAQLQERVVRLAL